MIATKLSMAKLHASLCFEGHGLGHCATLGASSIAPVISDRSKTFVQMFVVQARAFVQAFGVQGKTFVQTFWVQSKTFAGQKHYRC